MQSLIYDAYPDSLVTACAINMDSPVDYLRTFNLHMPVAHHAESIFSRMKIGWQYGAYPPLYLLIDKRGIIRWRSNGQGTITFTQLAEMVETLAVE